MLISDYLNTPNDSVSADTIQFDYADQTDFTSTSFSTNYDAEALISWNDSLYIFTKNWGNMWTNVYALPKTPGNYSIAKIDSINSEGLVTGATFNSISNTVVLSGYAFNDPFVLQISDFTSSQFSAANVNRTSIQLPASYSYQLEGIAPIGANNYYISTEESFSGTSGLFRLELNSSNALVIADQSINLVYPNPTSDALSIDFSAVEMIEMYASNGQFMTSTKGTKMNVSHLPSGVYLLIAKNKIGEIIGRERVVID